MSKNAMPLTVQESGYVVQHARLDRFVHLLDDFGRARVKALAKFVKQVGLAQPPINTMVRDGGTNPGSLIRWPCSFSCTTPRIHSTIASSGVSALSSLRRS